MPRHAPMPTIIGTGLTGLLISLALSNARIKHFLLGGSPPSHGPRLGESLNIGASAYFLTHYPELAHSYFTKGSFRLTTGAVVSGFDFSFLHDYSTGIQPIMRLLGKEPPVALIHVDRVRLDAALYEKTITNPYCTHLDGNAVEVRCAPNSAHIQSLILEDGTQLPVSHVVDATGHRRFLARQLQLPRRILGQPQHVAYAHYQRQPACPEARSAETWAEPWHHETSMWRLYGPTEGIEGMAWCIPLGNTVSVGVSTPVTDMLPPNEVLLQTAHALFEQRGITLQSDAYERSRIAQARMEFYTHPTAIYENWLLTGAAHSQIWWMSAIGIDMAIAAVHAIVPFVHQSTTIKARYQRYLNPLPALHSLWNWVATHPSAAATSARMQEFERVLYNATSRRFFNELLIEKQDQFSQATTLLLLQMIGRQTQSLRSVPGFAHRYRDYDDN